MEKLLVEIDQMIQIIQLKEMANFYIHVLSFTYKVHSTTNFKFTFGYKRNDFHWIWNEVIDGLEATVLYCSIRDEPEPQGSSGAWDDWGKV